MRWTLEIDDECLAAWRPIRSTFRFNSESPPAEWDDDDYKIGLLFRAGRYEVIPPHKGNHSASELKDVLLRGTGRSELTITRSHFVELGLWVNIVPGDSEGPQHPSGLETSAENYAAIFGRKDDKAAPEGLVPHPGGITIWPSRMSKDKGEREPFYLMGAYAGANTPRHIWYKFTFEMENAWATFRTRGGTALPENLKSPYKLAAPRAEDPAGKVLLPGPTPLDVGKEQPTVVFQEYGIPPGGDGRDPPPLP